MIKFTKLRYKNFLASGDQFTEIYLDRSPTTLITGDNGAGKSTFLDALTFGLYNKPFRKINKNQMVNSINGKGTVVEVEFQVGSRCYFVRRGIKPTKFEIYEGTSFDDLDNDDNLMAQDAKATDYQNKLERDILKMNYQAFTQIVILGKATYVPFMRLNAGDRRAVIEDLLGLKIYGVMNKLLKDKAKNLRSNIDAVETNLAMCEDKIENRQRYIDQVRNDRSAQIKDLDDEINHINENIDKLNGDIALLNDRRGTFEIDEDEFDSLSDRKNKLIDYRAKLRAKISNINDDIQLFVDGAEECPTCTQSIDSEFRNGKISDGEAEKEKLDGGLTKLASELDETKDTLSEMSDKLEMINKIDRKISTLQGSISQQQRQIDRINASKKKLDGAEVTEEDERIVAELREDFEDLKAQRDELQETNLYYQNISIMLRDDGIKTLIIQKYLPIFNEYINKYLNKMGFMVKFTLDDQFNEKILSRYRDDFSYNNFSEGQKLRIDLAILMTWREIAKLKNSLNTNLLIMDEVFDSSLDQDGVDAFMDILPSMGDSNIFVVSHTPDKLYDKFRSHIGFTLSNGFSIIDKDG